MTHLHFVTSNVLRIAHSTWLCVDSGLRSSPALCIALCPASISKFVVPASFGINSSFHPTAAPYRISSRRGTERVPTQDEASCPCRPEATYDSSCAAFVPQDTSAVRPRARAHVLPHGCSQPCTRRRCAVRVAGSIRVCNRWRYAYVIRFHLSFSIL